MDILKQIEKRKEKRISETPGTVEVARQLLAGDASAELTALRALGLDTEINMIHEGSILKEKNEKYTEKFKKLVFHTDDLVKIAMQYNLNISNTASYRGKIPGDLGVTLRKFADEHGLDIMKDSRFNNHAQRFFIMAPPKLFYDYYSLRDAFNDARDDHKSRVNKFINSFKDPLLFFQIDNDHFVLLQKWGNDLSFSRRILGEIKKTPERIKTFVKLTMLAIVAVFVYGATFCAQSISNHCSQHGFYFFIPLVGMGICIVGILMVLVRMKNFPTPFGKMSTAHLILRFHHKKVNSETF